MFPRIYKEFSDYKFLLSPETLWLVLSVVFFLFLIFSLILLYHWHKFGRKAISIGTMEIIYFAGSIFFILGAVASVTLF